MFEKSRISKEMISDAIDHHLIRFINDPSVGTGTVCAIGDNWFYFGGDAVENINAAELFQFFSKEKIVDILFQIFDDMIKTNDEESIDDYRYYYSFIRNNLKLLGTNEIVNTDPVKNLIYHLKKYQFEKGYDKNSENGILKVELSNKDIDTLLSVLNYANRNNFVSDNELRTLVTVVFAKEYSDEYYYDTYQLRIVGVFDSENLEDRLNDFFSDDKNNEYTYQECLQIVCNEMGINYTILDAKIPECDCYMAIFVFL